VCVYHGESRIGFAPRTLLSQMEANDPRRVTRTASSLRISGINGRSVERIGFELSRFVWLHQAPSARTQSLP